MNRCLCYKKNAQQCARDASTKQGTDHRFCWQHQACKRDTQPPKQPIKQLPKHSIEIFRHPNGLAFWICGDIHKYKDQLETIGAKYLPYKDCYVVSAAHKNKVLDFFGMNESQIQSKVIGKYQPPKQAPEQPIKESPKQAPEQPIKRSPKHSIEIFRHPNGLAFWICGDTNKYKDHLETIGAKYLPYKDCYVVSAAHKNKVLDFFGLNESQIQAEVIGKYQPPKQAPENPVKESPKQRAKQSVEIFRNVSGHGLYICGDIQQYTNQLETMGANYYPTKDCYVVSVKNQDEVLNLLGMNSNQIRPPLKGKYQPPE